MTELLGQEVRDHLAMVRASESLIPLVVEIAEEICTRLANGGTVFTFGNGGSAADAQHLAAELVGRYSRERRPLAAVSLATDPSVTTCIANDYGYQDVFARQVTALAGSSDVVIAFSTSGQSPNVVNGLAAARETGALTVLFTGESGMAAAQHADRVLRVRSKSTPRVQEGHLLLLHLLSEQIDHWAAAGEDSSGKDSSDEPLAGGEEAVNADRKGEHLRPRTR
jgi:D-sedoheptulose 7-phosphate isomerase